MVNYFKSKLYVVLCGCFIFASCFFTACKYKGVANIQEQIAIYQNMGFTLKTNPLPNPTLQNITININSLEQLNQYLQNNNIDSKINTLFILYLQKNADYIDCLIFIYGFLSDKNAILFYNHFNQASKNQLYLYNNYVIQKGISNYITNGATNYFYYNKFCTGLKQKAS